MINTRAIGAAKEKEACEYLEMKGYHILDRNFHSGRFAELDIVASNEGYLCFVEVKYRKDDICGGYEGAIDYRKIKKICRGAGYYMAYKKLPPDMPVRFDVVYIIGEEIILIKNAFDNV